MSGITHLRSGHTIVATPGTAVRIEDETGNPAAPCTSVILQALETNEGKIVFGGKSVVAEAGTHATPTRKGVSLAAGATAAIDINDPTGIWIDATVAGDGVSWVLSAA